MAVAAPSSVEPALIVNEIAEELISEPATGETLYRAQLKVVRRMHELISQGIIMPNSAITSTTSDVTWQIWVNNSISTVAFSPSHISMGTGNVTASCGTTTIVWNDWNEQYVINAGQILVPPKVSEEERARREAQARAYQEEMVRKDAERRAAEIKADALLHSCLSAEQKEELTKKNHFHLYVGKNKYRIERGISGNVKLINENDDRPKHQYCIHPVDVPVGDVMLAQKLLLETNEEEFLRVANRHW
jgi:hypothetical protein